MKERLLKIITAEGLTPALLADELGIQRSGISHILSGRNLPSFDFLQKLLTRFPKLNINWLISGQGAMYQTTGTAPLPDLFASNVPEKERKIENISEKPQIITSREGDKTERASPLPEISSSSKAKKEIETIVVFHTDKTFTVYSSEQTG